MTQRVRIECVSAGRQDPPPWIESLGGERDDGSRWQMSEDQALGAIARGEYSFYVGDGGRAIDVVAATHEGRRYLKTNADELRPDKLLALPGCP